MLCCIASIQADGSTDSAIIEDELYLVVYFNPYAAIGKFLSATTFYCANTKEWRC